MNDDDAEVEAVTSSSDADPSPRPGSEPAVSAGASVADDFVEIPQPRGWARRAGLIMLGVVVAVAVIAAGAVVWVRNQLDPGGVPGEAVVVEVPVGSTTADIGKQLEREGVIPNGTVFKWWVTWNDDGPFQAGRYEMHRHISVSEAVSVLSKGPLPPPVVKVSIPEGFRLAQIIARIHEQVPRFSVDALNAALSDGSVVSTLLPPSGNWEGLLFPATYEVGESQTPAGLLQQMATAMDERTTTAEFNAAATRLGLTRYELVTVASLIQAEAGNPDEAPKIARVVYNRLSRGEPLGIDATSRYLAILEGGEMDFSSSSPYNTRRQRGLPPTPIDSPGDFALQGAIHPADGPWIWYVLDVNKDAQGRPQHVFTDSESEFLRAKKACHDAGLGCG